ncbi:unnamed protein product, partial [Amoebophrya sp. A120]|eukprot:GSA120T00014978001.1
MPLDYDSIQSMSGGFDQPDYRDGRAGSWAGSQRAQSKRGAKKEDKGSAPARASAFGFFGRMANSIFGRQTVPDSPKSPGSFAARQRSESLDSTTSSELDDIWDDEQLQFHCPDMIEFTEFLGLLYNLFFVFVLLDPYFFYKILPPGKQLYDVDQMRDNIFVKGPFNLLVRTPAEVLRFAGYPLAAALLPEDKAAELVCAPLSFSNVNTCRNGVEETATAVGEYLGHALIDPTKQKVFSFLPYELQQFDFNSLPFSPKSVLSYLNPVGPYFSSSQEEQSFLTNLQALAAVQVLLGIFRYHALYQKTAFKKTSLLKLMRMASLFSGFLTLLLCCVVTADVNLNMAAIFVLVPEILVSAFSLFFIWYEQNRVATLLWTAVACCYQDAAAITPDVVRKFPKFAQGKTLFGASINLPPSSTIRLSFTEQGLRQSVQMIKDDASVNLSESFGPRFSEIPSLDTMLLAELYKLGYGLECGIEDHVLWFCQTIGFFSITICSIFLLVLQAYSTSFPGWVSLRTIGEILAVDDMVANNGTQQILPLIFLLQTVFVLAWSLAAVRAQRQGLDGERISANRGSSLGASLQITGASLYGAGGDYQTKNPLALQRGMTTESDSRITMQRGLTAELVGHSSDALTQKQNANQEAVVGVTDTDKHQEKRKSTGLRHVVKGYNDRDTNGYLFRDKEDEVHAAPPPDHSEVGRHLLRMGLGGDTSTSSATRESAAEAAPAGDATRAAASTGSRADVSKFSSDGYERPDSTVDISRKNSTSKKKQLMPGTSSSFAGGANTNNNNFPAVRSQYARAASTGSRRQTELEFGEFQRAKTVKRTDIDDTDFSLKPFNAQMVLDHGLSYVAETAYSSLRGKSHSVFAPIANEQRETLTLAGLQAGDYKRMRDYLLEQFSDPQDGTVLTPEEETQLANKIMIELKRQEQEDIVQRLGGAKLGEEPQELKQINRTFTYNKDLSSGRWSRGAEYSAYLNQRGFASSTKMPQESFVSAATTKPGLTPNVTMRLSSRRLLGNSVADYEELENAVRSFRLSTNFRGLNQQKFLHDLPFHTDDPKGAKISVRATTGSNSTTTFSYTTSYNPRLSFFEQRNSVIAQQLFLKPWILLCAEAVNVVYYPVHVVLAFSQEQKLAILAQLGIFAVLLSWVWNTASNTVAATGIAGVFGLLFLCFLYTQFIKKATGVQILDVEGFVAKFQASATATAGVALVDKLAEVTALTASLWGNVFAPRRRSSKELITTSTQFAGYDYKDVRKAARWMQRFGDTLTPWWIFFYTVYLELEWYRLKQKPYREQSKLSRLEFFQLGAASAWQDIYAGIGFYLVGKLWELLDPQTQLRNYTLFFAAYLLPLVSLLGSVAVKLLVGFQVGHELACPSWAERFPNLSAYPESFTLTIFAYVAVTAGTVGKSLVTFFLSAYFLRSSRASPRARSYLNAALWLINLSALSWVAAALLPALFRPAVAYPFQVPRTFHELIPEATPMPLRAYVFLNKAEQVLGFCLFAMGIRRMQNKESVLEKLVMRVLRFFSPTTSPITAITG